MRGRDTLHDKTQSSSRITEEKCKVNENVPENSDKHTDCNETMNSNRACLKPKAQYEMKGSFNEDSYHNRNHNSPQSAHRYEDRAQVTENSKKRIFISSVRKNDNMHTTEKRRKTVLNAFEAKLKIIIPESNPPRSAGVIKKNMKSIDKIKAVAVTIEKRNVKEELDNSDDDDDDANENNDYSRNLERMLGQEKTKEYKKRGLRRVQDTDSTVPDEDSSSNDESNVRIKEEVVRVNKDKEIPMSKPPDENATRLFQTSKGIEEDHHEADASMLEGAKSLEKEDSEWRQYLSPLTPHSGSSSSSSRTVSQMEFPCKTIDEKSDMAESDDSTEYYESASEDQNDEGGILTNLAKSVWGIFSLSCH